MSLIYDALKRVEEQDTVLSSNLPSLNDVKPAPMLDMERMSDLSDDLQMLYESIELSLATGDKPKVIAFCSPLAGEGTSTVAAYFGTLLARLRNKGGRQPGGNQMTQVAKTARHRPLIIDANLRRPMLHDAFGLERAQGLTELVEETIPVRSAIKRANRMGLHVITAGRPCVDPTEHLASPGLEALLNKLRTAFDYILLDLAPVVPYPDLMALCRKVDGVVLVLQSGVTRIEVAQSAVRRLKAANGNVLGAVLNKRVYHIPEFIYRMV